MPNVSAIIEYEEGTLDDDQVVELFADLIKNGTCWKLQGSYGRMAERLIEAKVIDHQGNINPDWRENAEG